MSLVFYDCFVVVVLIKVQLGIDGQYGYIEQEIKNEYLFDVDWQVVVDLYYCNYDVDNNEGEVKKYLINRVLVELVIEQFDYDQFLFLICELLNIKEQILFSCL